MLLCLGHLVCPQESHEESSDFDQLTTLVKLCKLSVNIQKINVFMNREQELTLIVDPGRLLDSCK